MMKHTKETKKKISESVKKLWKNIEYRKNHIDKKKLYIFTEENKANLRKAKVNNATKYWEGKQFSENTKKKMSESHNEFWGNNNGKDIIVVHHKNGNHFDDRTKNKKEMTNSEHTTLHWDQGDIRNGRIKLNKEVI